MGVIGDGAVAVLGLGIPIVATGIAVAVTADAYLRTYPNDESDKGQRSTVYNSVVFLQFFSVATILMTATYVIWSYINSRHRIIPEAAATAAAKKADQRARKLTSMSLKRLQRSNFALGTSSPRHRSLVTFTTAAISLSWLVPSLIMCFQGWLYRYKKTEDSTNVLTVCNNKTRTPTCDALFNVGVASLVECIFEIGLLAVCAVTMMSKSGNEDKDLKTLREMNAKTQADLEKQITAFQDMQKKHQAASADLAKARENARLWEDRLRTPKIPRIQNVPGGYSRDGRAYLKHPSGGRDPRAFWSQRENNGEGAWRPIARAREHRTGLPRRGRFHQTDTDHDGNPIFDLYHAPSSAGSSMESRRR